MIKSRDGLCIYAFREEAPLLLPYVCLPPKRQRNVPCPIYPSLPYPFWTPSPSSACLRASLLFGWHGCWWMSHQQPCHSLILRATPGSRVPEQKNVRESISIPGPIIKSHLSILFENKL